MVVKIFKKQFNILFCGKATPDGVVFLRWYHRPHCYRKATPDGVVVCGVRIIISPQTAL